MRTTDALREIMKIKELRPSVLAARMGIKGNVLSERFGQKNISVAKLNEMLRPMDYKIVLVPREFRTPDGGFEIE